MRGWGGRAKDGGEERGGGRGREEGEERGGGCGREEGEGHKQGQRKKKSAVREAVKAVGRGRATKRIMTLEDS